MELIVNLIKIWFYSVYMNHKNTMPHCGTQRSAQKKTRSREGTKKRR